MTLINPQKKLLSGSEWYCHQAFRALNQAAGRCIRHKFDYGAIILLDERYTEQRNLTYISKWLRSSIKSYNNFNDSLKGLENFFKDKKILEDDSNDHNDIINDKEKLELFKSSNQVTPLMRDQRINKSSNHIGNKQVKIDQFTITSTCLVNDSSGFQPQTPEFPISLSCGQSSNGLSVSPENLASAGSRDPKSENLKVFQHFHQFPETPSSISCGTAANGFTSEDTSEKFASPEPSDAKQDHQRVVLSVSSCNKKQRRATFLQNATYPEMHCSNLSFDESNTQFGLPASVKIAKSTDQRTKHSFEDDDTVKPELFNSKNQDIPSPSSHLCNEMELHLRCSACNNPLGLAENGFLVKSLMMPTSKVFLTCMRIYGTQGSSFILERLSKTSPTVISVLSSEIMFINELIVKGRHVKTNHLNHGVWCEEDGCVFKNVFCPFCKGCDTCLGVHVLATDAANVDLLNKVLFYADCLCFGEPRTFETTLPRSGDHLDRCSDHVENAKYTREVSSYDANQKPSAIMKSTDKPQSLPVDNKKPSFSQNHILVAHKTPCNHQPKPVEIEKFAYKSETFEKFPSNTQNVPVHNEKFAHCCQPKASYSLATTKSKLKLPRRH